jgi:hypothetical protein
MAILFMREYILAESPSESPNMRIVPHNLLRQEVQCYDAWRTSGWSSDMDSVSPRRGVPAFILETRRVDEGEREYHKLQVEQQAYPLRLAKIGERTYWQFQDRVYWENGASTPMRFMPCSSQSSSESAAASNEPKRWLQWACSHRTRRAAGT